MILRNSHTDVLNMMNKFTFPIRAIDNLANNKLKGKFTENDYTNTLIKSVIFSDSVMLISNDESEESIMNMLLFINLIFTLSLMIGVPIKGAVAHGRLTADFKKSLYFGKPLIDAYELQTEIKIYGAVLHHSAEKYLTDQQIIDKLDNKYLMKYNTPVKQGHAYHYLVKLDMIGAFDDTVNESITKLYCNTSGSTRQYIDNTVEYFNVIRKSREL